MSAKSEPLEVTMTREVKVLYFNSMANSQEFHQKPFLDREMFRRHFATVAHRHRIFHKENSEGRAQYNLYFRLVQTNLYAGIKRLAKNEAERHPPIQPIRPHQRVPEQLCFSYNDPRVAEARKKLAVLRDEMANRPSLC